MFFKKTTSRLSFLKTRVEKSRRDGILLTVGFNLRKLNGHIRSKSRRDGILSIHNVVPAGLLIEYTALLVRRLKPTVIDMSSLRDFSPLKLHCYKLFIFHPYANEY